MREWESNKNTTTLQGQRTNGHATWHQELYFRESVVVAVSYLVHYETLSRNATDILKKCYRYFIAKCDKNLLVNTSGFHHKMLQLYYKMWEVLQLCELYWKMRRYANFIAKCFDTMYLCFCTINYKMIFDPISFLCLW